MYYCRRWVGDVQLSNAAWRNEGGRHLHREATVGRGDPTGAGAAGMEHSCLAGCVVNDNWVGRGTRAQACCGAPASSAAPPASAHSLQTLTRPAEVIHPPTATRLPPAPTNRRPACLAVDPSRQPSDEALSMAQQNPLAYPLISWWRHPRDFLSSDRANRTRMLATIQPPPTPCLSHMTSSTFFVKA